MARLNAVIPNQDNSQVRVGPGNRWGDVYSLLDTMNLTVAGGRSRTVGVGGLVLSGKYSVRFVEYSLQLTDVL
jgi:FAD/FMN-containing dehydrogenase